MVIKIVPLFPSEYIGRYNIGSACCDEKVYSPEAEKAPTQFASAPFQSLYLYESHYRGKNDKLVPVPVLEPLTLIYPGQTSY